jgi:hypothetical protein
MAQTGDGFFALPAEIDEVFMEHPEDAVPGGEDPAEVSQGAGARSGSRRRRWR